MLPLAMIWVAAMAARAAQDVRAQNQRLAAAIDSMRQAQTARDQRGRHDPVAALGPRLDALIAAQNAMDNRLALLSSALIAEGGTGPHDTVPDDPDQDDQPTLSLEPPRDAPPPLDNADFIRALHFPETAEDTEGFDALRLALRDHPTAQLIQAAQDVLTLLSQDGLYMEEIPAEHTRPDLWRAFAEGKRGREVAALAGVTDREAVSRVGRRMKQDPIFRDAVHHFLRRFDRRFAAFEPGASDAEIGAFAMTRTARAFMLLGRVSGTFD